MLVQTNGFCDTPFWDLSRTWHAYVPELTPCFENTVLMCIPVGLLWFLTPWHLWKRRRSASEVLPLNASVLIEHVFTLCLLLTSAVCFVFDFLDGACGSTVMARGFKAVSFLLAFVIRTADRRRGVVSSTVVFTFWFAMAVCDLPAFYRVLLHVFRNRNQDRPPLTEFAMRALSYPVIIAQLFFCAFGGSRGRKGSQKTSPAEQASPPSLMFFEWLTPLIWKAYRKGLSLEDLYDIPEGLKTQANFELWDRAWRCEQASHGRSVLKTCLRLFWKQILLSYAAVMCFVLLRLSSALLIDRIIRHLRDEKEEPWKGYLYVGVMFLAGSVSALAYRFSENTFITVGLRCKGALSAAVYRKTLRLSGYASRRLTTGELTNLLFTDVDKVVQLSTCAAIAVAAPANVVCSAFFLWLYLGPSCLAGIAVTFLIMLVTGGIGHRCRRLYRQRTVLKDSRLREMGQVLSNVKTIKLYAWEDPFVRRVRSMRGEETDILERLTYWIAALRAFWTLTPFLVSLLAYATFIYSEHVTVLDARTAFVPLAIFNIMRGIVSVIPDLVSNVAQTSVSMHRIEDFLRSEDIHPYVVRVSGGDSICLDNASFSWPESAHLALSPVTISLKRGHLVAIVGQVGSGKSSLLLGILGELQLESGTVNVGGTVAYVPQSAWILNRTVQENVLLEKAFVPSLYHDVLDACCLSYDVAAMPDADWTEIGERGVNLSGGQKQRVGLARAVYQDCDVYLLDDPLSAVDSHVGTSIFESVIGPNGILSRKTRVLTTNDLSVLPRADLVVYVDNGHVLEAGTYENLIASGKSFAGLVSEHGRKNQATADERKDVSPELRKCAQRHRHPAGEGDRVKEQRPEFHLVKDETVESGSVKARVYLTYLRHVDSSLIVVTMLGFSISCGCDVGANLWLSAWSRDAAVPESERSPALRLGIYAALGFCQGLFCYAATAAVARGTVRAATRLHDRMLDAVMKAPMSFFDSTPLGRLLNRFGTDVSQLDVQLPVAANRFLELLFQVLGASVLVASRMPWFLIVVLLIAGVLCLVGRVSLEAIRQLKRMECVTRSMVYTHYTETVEGLSSIRAFTVQKEFTKRFDARLDNTQNCSCLLFHARMWMTTRLSAIGQVLILLVSIGVVLQRGAMSDAEGGLLVSYVTACSFYLIFLVHYASETEAAVVASERLDEYSKVASEGPWKASPGPSETWPEQGAVAFSDYSAKYREGLDLVLRGVNLVIKPGERIGVIGRTGAGKSSLALSLYRIIEPTGGKIVIDGTDISSVGLHDLRSRLCIIPQDPVLFAGTLRFNLDPNGEYSDSDLNAALQGAGVQHHFPEGLQSEIHEGGQNFSLGQRQLVCLVRALLRKPSILVLDEATASVDVDTDALVRDTIFNDFAGCTVITIAHRFQTIMKCDRVVVMSNGRVTEEGSPAALLLVPHSEFMSLAREAGMMQ